jgi:hypothetical protein
MKAILKALASACSPSSSLALDVEGLEKAMVEVMEGRATPAQVGSLLTMLYLSRLDREPWVVTIWYGLYFYIFYIYAILCRSLCLLYFLIGSFVFIYLRRSLFYAFSVKILHRYALSIPGSCSSVVDIVGTGGDGFHTFNACTTK